MTDRLNGLSRSSQRSSSTRPDDFGRFAATIARQLIMQRIRDAEDEAKYGEFSGRVGDIVSGVIQQSRPGDVALDLGRIEAILVGVRAGAGGEVRAR